MGLFYRDPKYDNPITNPLVDWLYYVWGGSDLVKVKRWQRRKELNRRLNWWYDEDHPARGVRALSIMVLLFTILALVVSGRLAGAGICLSQAGCVLTQDGGVTAIRSTGPHELRP